MNFKKIFLVTGLCLSLAACNHEEAAENAPTVQVTGQRIVFSPNDPAMAFLKTDVVQADAGGSVRLPGRAIWDETRTVRVVPPLPGKVESVLVKPGDVVKSGQALAILSSPDYGQVRADWRKAEAASALAGQNLQRSRELHAAGVIPAKELQQVEADHAAAVAEAARAYSRYHQLAEVSGDGQSYALASPIAGTVVETNVNPGQQLGADTPPLFVVTDPAYMWVSLDEHEDEMALLDTKKGILVETSAYPGVTFPAHITHVSEFVDPVSRTVKLRAELAQAEHNLKGNMFVTAAIPTRPSGHLLVAATAILLDSDGSHLAFVETAPANYERRAVKVVRKRDERVEIAEGLKEGEKIVVEGNLYLMRLFRNEQGAAPAAGKGAK